MTNNGSHGSGRALPMSSYSNNPGAGSAINRRSSYASVVSGTAGAPAFVPPLRSGALAQQLANNGYISREHGLHSPAHSRGISRGSMETDGLAGGIPRSWPAGGPRAYGGSFSFQYRTSTDDVDHQPSFFVPSYLRGSRHSEQLEEQHNRRIAAQQELRPSNGKHADALPGSLSSSSSSANLHKMVPSHRGMTHDVVERVPPLFDEQVAPWPTRWNEHDKSAGLDVQADGLEVKFLGISRTTHDEAPSIRADYPMPRPCGIYYYEVTIMSKGKESLIGIGFSGPKTPLNRLPGWDSESWAYHGDDGNKFCCNSNGHTYGPKYSSGDIIGCGVNFRTGQGFFTKNGVPLGAAFRDIKGRELYPSIGMKKPGEHIRANFGQTPFVFDINRLMEDEKAVIQAEILKASVASLNPPLNEMALIHQLVAQFLSHDGYVETARAFCNEVLSESVALANGTSAAVTGLDPKEDADAVNRQKIRAAILDGDIDAAIKKTNAYYPNVLRANEDIYFKLRCRKFIELIRRCAELLEASKNADGKQRSGANSTNGHTVEDTTTFDMEIDDQAPNTTNGSTDLDGAEEMDTDDRSITGVTKYELLQQQAILYGQELQSEFKDDPRREVKKALEDTFSLIAWEDPRKSKMAWLMDKDGRAAVAEELNGAILVSLGKSSAAALERLVQQTEVLVSDLAEDGGVGAFVNVRRDYLR